MLELLTSFSSYSLMSEFTCLIIVGGSIMFSLVRIGCRQYKGCGNWRMPQPSSSYRPSSMSWWYVYSRAMVLHTLHRVQSYTYNLSLNYSSANKLYSYFCSIPGVLFHLPPSLFSPFRRRHCQFRPPHQVNSHLSHHHVHTHAPVAYATTIVVLG